MRGIIQGFQGFSGNYSGVSGVFREFRDFQGFQGTFRGFQGTPEFYSGVFFRECVAIPWTTSGGPAKRRPPNSQSGCGGFEKHLYTSSSS